MDRISQEDIRFMTGTERREAIIEMMQNDHTPVSGTKMASVYGVSRQVIVQDIALIRAAGYDVISTNKGYLLNTPVENKIVERIFKVNHTDEQIEEELFCIVDLGGCIENTMVNHKVYGHLEAPLNIKSRRNVAEFMTDIQSGKSSPLKNVTSGYHYHTITADSEETMKLIEKMLREKQFLVE